MKKARDLHLLLKTIRRSSTSTTTHSKMDPSDRYCFSPILRWNPEVENYFIKAYGADHFSIISKALTRPSSYSCVRVNTLKSTSDAVIEKLLEIIKEKGFDGDCHGKEGSGPNENVGSPLEESLKNGPIVKCPIPGLEYVLFVKGTGPHMIDYGYVPGAPPKEVIVGRKCAEAVLRGAQVFVPGVMACSAHVEKGDTVAVSAAIEQRNPNGGWSIGITRGTVLQGSQTDPYYFERSGLYVGQGTATMSRAGLFRASEGIAVDMNNRVFRLPSFYDVLDGEIFLQNLPSIVTAHALDPQKGERILDMCAAPGGKTTAIAILMKDEGELVAIDRSHNKDIQKLAAEMSLTCITTYKLDVLKAIRQRNEADDANTNQSSNSLRFDEEKASSSTAEGFNLDKTCEDNVSNAIENGGTYVSKADIRKAKRRMRNGPGRNQCVGGRVENSKGFYPDSFDRVLLDAPCSALGLRPRLFAGEETIDSLKRHATYQRRMFDQAVKLVRPGGVIVYSTCTINPGENEALVRYALDTYKFLSLASQNPRIGGPGLVGSFESPDGRTEEWLRPGEEEFVQRFDPSSSLDTIGFFIAKFSVGTKDV
ncbi:PREDICTED: putative methyltransferase NSUN6 isoform X2 [Populus euphratica]|uniref:Methyltransferase NSUN6 isoform X2 n=1 Tax=Populus euphratica TaxID=75702 RepID=A0AAJ6VBE6_POPEU|nr:PREDICTED: putative methyltransferase NSUN6 isoform X2 [Populus euphratica]